MELTLFVCRLRVACNEATIYSRMPPRHAARDTPILCVRERVCEDPSGLESIGAARGEGKGVCSSGKNPESQLMTRYQSFVLE